MNIMMMQTGLKRETNFDPPFKIETYKMPSNLPDTRRSRPVEMTASVHDTVSNLSSTKALKEITLKHGGQYFPSAVGEVNVVNKMKEVNAVIGGEGNGGIIVPDLHYGRDALIGIGLFWRGNKHFWPMSFV